MECAWINNYLVVETDGFTRPCCLETSPEARVSPISSGIVKSFNHRKLKKLKFDLEQGYSEKTDPFCRRCRFLEDKNQPSMRTDQPFITKERELKVLQFKLSNKCQLACAHCNPSLSSTWANLLGVSPKVHHALELTDEFVDELKQVVPTLDELKFTGGEPFLDHNHWKMLEHLQDVDTSNCKLSYITNGLIKPKKELWEGWKEIDIDVSVDGHKDTYEWFRRNANWQQLVDNVKELAKYGNVRIAYSMTPFTVDSLQDAKDFWPYQINETPIVYPTHANLNKFPDNIDICREFAKDWDQRWNTPGWANKLYNWVDPENKNNA